MDSSDWIRMKRLAAFYRNATPNVDASPIPCCTGVRNVKRYSEFGVPRIQRPASFYTDGIAAARLRYVLQTPTDSCGDNGAKALTAYWVCGCGSTDVVKHNGVCVKCKI